MRDFINKYYSDKGYTITDRFVVNYITTVETPFQGKDTHTLHRLELINTVANEKPTTLIFSTTNLPEEESLEKFQTFVTNELNTRQLERLEYKEVIRMSPEKVNIFGNPYEIQ